jgi:hypothetical protein
VTHPLIDVLIDYVEPGFSRDTIAIDIITFPSGFIFNGYETPLHREGPEHIPG